MDELIGYEQERPWLFGKVVDWRLCLECALPSQQTSVPTKPLTRQMVEVECNELRAQGVEHCGPHRDWRGLQQEQCWVCGKHLISGKKPRKRPIDGLKVAQRFPYQLRHILTPDLLKNSYPQMTELERLEVLAYVTKLQRSKPSYQDMSTEDRLAAAQALLQRWLDWTDEIDGSHDWRFPAHSERALTKLFKDTSSLIEQASSSLREG